MSVRLKTRRGLRHQRYKDGDPFTRRMSELFRAFNDAYVEALKVAIDVDMSDYGSGDPELAEDIERSMDARWDT